MNLPHEVKYCILWSFCGTSESFRTRYVLNSEYRKLYFNTQEQAEGEVEELKETKRHEDEELDFYVKNYGLDTISFTICKVTTELVKVI